jgi:TP901 family phage tail tape measure protein
MTDIVKLGYDVDTSKVKSGEDALDRLTDATTGADGAAKKFDKTQHSLSGAIGGLVGKLGVLAAGYVSVQTAMSAVTMARDFSAAMAETSTLIDGTAQEMSVLEASARSMAREFGGSATSQVQAFYQAISAGAGSVEQASVLLDAANKLAVGGVTDVTTGVDVLTTAVNAYGPSVLSAADASDALFVGMKAGKTTIGELSAALGNILPLSSALGVSFDETVAATAALTTQGLTTAQSVTGLRAAMTAVTGPTKQAAELAKALGIEFNSSALKSKGLATFLNDVIAKTGGSADAMRALFGSVEATTAVLALAGGGSAALATTLEAMEAKAGSADAAFEKISANLNERLNVQMAILADAALTVGQAILSVAVPAIEAATRTAALLSQNLDTVLVVITAMAATQIPAMVAALATAAAGMTTLSAVSGIATAAITALRAGLVALGGPLGLVYGLLGGAAAYFLITRDNAKEAETGFYDAAAGTAALNGELDVFYQTGAPSAGKAAISLANDNHKLAASAYDAAKAELAKAKAIQTSRLGEAPDWIKDAVSNGANIPEVTAATKALADAEAGLAQAMRDRKTAATAVSGADYSTVTVPLPDLPAMPGLDIPSILAGGGKDGSKGGGKGKDDGYKSALEALKQSLATERETLELWRDESDELLADRRSRELMTEEEHKEALIRVEKEYQERLAAINAAASQTKLQDTATLFGALASVAAAGGKKLARVAAVAQAIEGTINAYGAAVKALNTPGLSLAGRFAAYASVLAVGLRGVAAIKSAGGGGSSGGGSISATEAPAAEPIPQHVLIDMPNAPEWLKGMAEEMFTQFQDQISEGRKLVFSR